MTSPLRSFREPSRHVTLFGLWIKPTSFQLQQILKNYETQETWKKHTPKTHKMRRLLVNCAGSKNNDGIVRGSTSSYWVKRGHYLCQLGHWEEFHGQG